MSVETELPQRLYDAAEAFYYSGVLTCLPFDALNVDAGDYRHAEWAAEAAASGQQRRNRLGAPPLVNFGFSIELYLKLLIVLSGGKSVREHDLYKLFLKLEKGAQHVAQCLVRNHQHVRGCREEFLEILKAEASVFEDWRYAHEKEFLCSSPDTLLMI